MNLASMSYNYSAYDSAFEDAFASTLKTGIFASIGIIIFMLVLGLATAILMIVSWWKIFSKAGKPGWAAIVPVYSFWVMLEIVGLPGWLSLGMLFTFIPFVGYLIGLGIFGLNIYVAIKIAPMFGKDTGFAIGLILLPIVFYPMLAFGKNEYVMEAVNVTPTDEPPVTPEPPVE